MTELVGPRRAGPTRDASARSETTVCFPELRSDEETKRGVYGRLNPHDPSIRQLVEHRLALQDALSLFIEEIDESTARLGERHPEHQANLNRLRQLARESIDADLGARAISSNGDLFELRTKLTPRGSPTELCSKVQRARTESSELFNDLDRLRRQFRASMEELCGHETVRSLIGDIGERIDAAIEQLEGLVGTALTRLGISLEAERQLLVRELVRAHKLKPPQTSVEHETQPPKSVYHEEEDQRGNREERWCIHETKTVLDSPPQFEARFLVEKRGFEVPVLARPLTSEHSAQADNEELRRRVQERGAEPVSDIHGEVSRAEALNAQEAEVLDSVQELYERRRKMPFRLT